ncbi:MAG: cyclodeaminase/cyclohydrolase family protein, partial [Bacteroidetes bacterium]|nr:cyclodeaminase/cyclohydrolase family protein [Bacteroidota bacterium]
NQKRSPRFKKFCLFCLFVLTLTFSNAIIAKSSTNSNQLKAVDDDTNAFNAYMDARRLPNKTDDEKKIRDEAIQSGLKKAVHVPLNTAQLSYQAIEIADVVVKNSNPNSITDVGVGVQSAYTGVLGGIYNVLINLKDIKDDKFNDEMRKTCAELKSKAQKKLSDVLNYVESKL